MFLNGYVLHDESRTDPYARFCGQTEAGASSDPIGRTNRGSRRHWLSLSFYWFFEQEPGKSFRKNSDSPHLILIAFSAVDDKGDYRK